MSPTLPSISKIAEILGGDVAGADALVPGPGHSAEDRSLSIKLDKAVPDGFMVYSFAGDDPISCRDYVRQKLGLPEFAPRKKKANGGAKPFSPTVAEYIYRLADGTPYLRVQRTTAKDFFQSHWDGEKWVGGKPKGPKVPYRLPELIAAAPTTPIYIIEGEKDADNLAAISLVATCNSSGADNGSGGKWTSDLNQYFKDRIVYIIPDNDAQGRKHAQHVARNLHPVAKSVQVVELPDLEPGGDVTDWLRSDTAGVRLSKLAKTEPLWEPGEPTGGGASEEELIRELAGLSKLQYARRRLDAAKRIGIGVGRLDEIVIEARGASKGEGEEGTDVLYKHWTVEPWPEPVDGGILLRAIKETIQRYVFMSEHQAVAVTLWIVFSCIHELMTHSVILLITSPEKNSGKSTLAGVLNFLVRRGLQSVSISGPALFRSIKKWMPTFVIDEADKALAKNSDLCEVINSGWTRGYGVIRCNSETQDPELFSTFAPKIVAMKGRNLEDTTLSRTIEIRMRRKRKGEHAAKFSHVDSETFVRLRSQLLRWSIDNAEAIAKATPEIPFGFDNRREDNWIPLLAIAEACGGEWKKAAWTAALTLEDITDDTSIGVQLLQAIKATFEARANAEKNKDRIKSEDLIKELEADATAPWATWNKGKLISERQVAKMLKDYETPEGTPIKPRTVRFDDGTKKGTTAKGYLLEWFADAFDRFCTSSGSSSPEAPDPSATSSCAPPEEPNLSVTSVTSLKTQDFSEFSSVTSQCNVTDKKDGKSFKNNDVTDVTDKNDVEEPRREGIACVTDGSGEEPGLHPQQIRDLARWYNEEAYDRLAGSVLDQEALNGELKRRLREEYGVLPEYVEIEFERAMQVAFAPPQAAPSPPPRVGMATEKAANPARYQVLGAAPPGEKCLGCGNAYGAKRIKWHDGNVDFLHPACADSYLAALANPPVKITQLDADDDPDAWQPEP